MIRTSVAAAALALLATVNPGFAGQSDNAAPNAAAPAPKASNDRLMIVNGYTGRVVFDDRQDDQFCVIRRYLVGYDDDGRRIIRRSLHCR
jgi:hypothetical protein